MQSANLSNQSRDGDPSLELTNQGSVFALDFLQTQRHLSASAANFMLVGAGLPGIAIMLLAGSLSDRVGRRLVGSSFAAASLVGAAVFFWAPGGILVLFPALALVLVGQLGAWPALSSYSVELFPTALRGQAGSWLAVARVGGDASSLALGSVLISSAGGLAPAVSVLASGPLIAIVIVVVCFPDTHGRELEEITDEPHQPPVAEAANADPPRIVMIETP